MMSEVTIFTTALTMNSETTAMMMNSEILTTGVLAVIIIIPSLFSLMVLIALTTIIIILVHKRRTKQGTQAEAYYSTVGPPLPPAKLERNRSYEGSLESLRIANKENNIDNNSDRFYDKITCTDTSIHYQPIEIVTTNANRAYYHTNTATAPEIQPEENVAYSHTELIDTTENVAYGTNIAIAPEIHVEEKVLPIVANLMKTLLDQLKTHNLYRMKMPPKRYVSNHAYGNDFIFDCPRNRNSKLIIIHGHN